MGNIKKCLAEIIGTFTLVFVACGVAAVTGCNGEANASYILTALAFGGVIVAMAYSIGNISGCHINPAVSIAVWINKKMSTKVFFYGPYAYNWRPLRNALRKVLSKNKLSKKKF